MKVCREAFYERATLTVRPTKLGLKVIDEPHDCYAMKFIRNKPIRTIEDDQWLRLIQVKKFTSPIHPKVLF
jgi:transcription elongation factor SPT6